MSVDPTSTFAAGHVCVCVTPGIDIRQLSRKTLQRVLELLNFQVDVVVGSGFLSLSRLLPSSLYPASLEKLLIFIAL